MAGPLRRLVPDFIRRSYVLKFGITLLILGLSIGAIGFVGTDLIRQEVTDNADADLGARSSQEAQAFEQWNQRNKLVLRNLADSNSARSANPRRMQQFINGRLTDRNALPGGVAIHYVDVDENVVLASTQESLQDGTPSLSGLERPWASRLESASVGPEEPATYPGYTAEGFFPGYTGRAEAPVLTYAMRPPGLQSTVVVYEVDVSSYQSAANPNRGSFVYIVNQSAAEMSAGRQIVYDSSGERTFQRFEDQGIIESSLEINPDTAPGERVVGPFSPSNVADSVPSDYRNQQYLASYDEVGNSNYAAVIYAPRSETYGFVTQVSRFGALATLAGVLLIGIIGAVLGRNTATSIDRLRKKSEEMEQGNLDVDFEHQRVDNIGRLYDGMANMRDALRTQITEARQAREEAELARERAEQTSRHLQTKANEYRDVMQAVAAGDLGRRMTPSDQNEAMAGIAEEFNDMIAEIEATVTQLKEFANEVATSSEEVTASAEEVRSASQQVTESIQEISEGAERQNDSLQSVSREMSGLSTTVEEIASLSNEVADLSERTAETGRRGREAAQDAIEGMNQIEAESEQAVDQIERLEEEMNQIDELIEFITDVANQTNMLALNANIEASRAGQGGDAEGFAVVANEVKDLAEETKGAAEDIEQRLQRIQGQTEDTVDSVRTTGERIAEHTDSVRNAVEALDEIAGYAQETNTGVQEISAATEEQAASTEEVVAMVDEAATISERTSRESENVAAAAEEQTTAMTEVSNSAGDLSEQASRLSEALDRFETGGEGPVEGSGVDAPPSPDRPPAPGTDAGDDLGGGDVGDDLSGGGDDMPAGVEELAAEFDDGALEGPGEEEPLEAPEDDEPIEAPGDDGPELEEFPEAEPPPEDADPLEADLDEAAGAPAPDPEGSGPPEGAAAGPDEDGPDETTAEEAALEDLVDDESLGGTEPATFEDGDDDDRPEGEAPVVEDDADDGDD